MVQLKIMRGRNTVYKSNIPKINSQNKREQL